MAMFTPAQKPRGFARTTCIDFLREKRVLEQQAPRHYRFIARGTTDFAGDVRRLNRKPATKPTDFQMKVLRLRHSQGCVQLKKSRRDVPLKDGSDIGVLIRRPLRVVACKTIGAGFIW